MEQNGFFGQILLNKAIWSYKFIDEEKKTKKFPYIPYIMHNELPWQRISEYDYDLSNK